MNRPVRLGLYEEGHRDGYDAGFREASQIVELERDGYRKSKEATALMCADALTIVWQRMSMFLAGRQRRVGCGELAREKD